MSEKFLTRRSFIGLAAMLSAATLMPGCSSPFIESVKDVNLKEKYFNNTILSEFGEYIKRCVDGKENFVDVIYIDEGAIDVGAFVEKYATENIYIQNETKTVDTLTTECATNFFDSLYTEAIENINKFLVYNNPNYNLRTIINTAMQNYDDNGIPTVIFFTSQSKKEANEITQMNELNDIFGEAMKHGVYIVSSGGRGEEDISDFKYTCCNNVITINSCNYDGKARGNENYSGDKAKVKYAVPSDNSLISASVFAACLTQILMKNSKTSNIMGMLDNYAITGINPEETSGNGILSTRTLA